MYHYAGSNNSTYMIGRRTAETLRKATHDALEYLRGELMREGTVAIYDSPTGEFPILTFERSIHTQYRCIRTDKNGNQRKVEL